MEIGMKNVDPKKSNAPQGILRYININKRKINTQNGYRTEKKVKNNETNPIKTIALHC